MVKRKMKNTQSSIKMTYLLIAIIVFAIAFVLLINKQKKDDYLADILDNNFSV